MTDTAVVGRILDEYHDRRALPHGIRKLSGSERSNRVTYEVTLPTGGCQVIRAFLADGTVPAYAAGPGVTLADWLAARARTLMFLAAAGYPAPQLVATRTGELVGVAGPWLTLATTHVPGEPIVPTLDQLQLLGGALGCLHSVPVPDAPDGWLEPGLAATDPAQAVPAVLTRLAAVAGKVPADWIWLRDQILEVANAVMAGAPACTRCLVHGDAWARNVVQTAPDSVVLIDWETGGRGLAVIDLGQCLMESHLDARLPDERPDQWFIAAAEPRIAAVAAGYSGERSLSAAELELLPAAVKFPAAVVGAIHLEAALSDGSHGPSMDARLARIRNWISVADEVAAAAMPHLVR